MTGRLHRVGVRHHSPACARLVEHTLRTVRPAVVLVEGPSDLNGRLGELLLDHELPIALFSFLRVDGDSMSGAGILTGDLIVVDKSLSPRAGTIVVAEVGGEFTVKHLERDGAGLPRDRQAPDAVSVRSLTLKFIMPGLDPGIFLPADKKLRQRTISAQ